MLQVLVEGTPEDLDLLELCSDMEDVPGVTVIHDVHASIGVLADPDHVGDYDDMLRTLRRIANEEHGIAHTTIQLETSVRGCDGEDHHVDHLLERQMARKKRRFTFGHHHRGSPGLTGE